METRKKARSGIDPLQFVTVWVDLKTHVRVVNSPYLFSLLLFSCRAAMHSRIQGLSALEVWLNLVFDHQVWSKAGNKESFKNLFPRSEQFHSWQLWQCKDICWTNCYLLHIAITVRNGCDGEWKKSLTQHIAMPAVLTVCTSHNS